MSGGYHHARNMNSKLALNYLSIAFDDYIDARVLIRQNRLLNGGHLSALATEKLLKALILTRGLVPKRVHLDHASQLISQISAGIPAYQDFIDVAFLHYLGRIFRMRYYPDQAADQISISRNKLLWELDRLFDRVHDRLRFGSRDVIAAYLREKQSKSPLLFEDNEWLLGKHELADLEALPDLLEAVYRRISGETIGIRKELPKTFISCKIGEEVIITEGKR